jgi:hypothetical protein
VLREGAGPYLALVRAGKLSTQEALDLMRDNKEHLAVVRTMKRTLVGIHCVHCQLTCSIFNLPA